MSKTKTNKRTSERFSPLKYLVRWVPIAAVVGTMAGTASAVLLASLTLATQLREAHVWLIWLLAPAGYCVGMMYRHYGRSVEGGNNLILEQLHLPTKVIPLRMTPLILVGTFVSHVFGASVGREGTALQTGASLADQLTGRFRLSASDRRVLLMAGLAAGFGSVFGTPLAGAVFGIEVLVIGKLSYEAVVPCLLAAFLGDWVTRWWAETILSGAHHTVYSVSVLPHVSVMGILSAAVAGVTFGLVAMAFARLTHAISIGMKRLISRSELRPVVGGLAVSIVVFAVGSSRTLKYLGLGVPTIVASFQGKLPVHDFAAKFLFTSVSLGTGFKGGEVTPLFYIGSTMGNALSRVLPLPTGLLAGMGFAAVFAGAANTPIASTLMAMELFGVEAGLYAGIACALSYLFSGHTGIYHAQKVGRSKYPWRHKVLEEEDASLL